MVHPDLLSSCLLDIAKDYHPIDNDNNNNDKKNSSGDNNDNVILYLPITFTGKTSTSSQSPNQHIIVDTYHSYLQQLGHSIHHEDLLSSFNTHGIRLIDVQPSHWWIERNKHRCLWDSMYHFIVMGVALELWDQCDILSWCHELKKNSYAFQIENVDILATIPRVSQSLDFNDFKDMSSDQLFTENNRSLSLRSYRYLEFIAPRKLRISEPSMVPPLLSGQVLIAVNCSLISPGMRCVGSWYLIQY